MKPSCPFKNCPNFGKKNVTLCHSGTEYMYFECNVCEGAIKVKTPHGVNYGKSITVN